MPPPPTGHDVFLSMFYTGRVRRYYPVGDPTDDHCPYALAWDTYAGASTVIGMTDDGQYLYVVTWNYDVVMRIDMTTGLLDPSWSIRPSLHGINFGDMESITIRQKGANTTLITGWADAAFDSANNTRVNWAEWDLRTGALIQAHVFVNARRGCDWVWMINDDEFVTGTEGPYFYRINAVTLEETAYLAAPGFVSYTIEVRNGRFIAVTGNGGPILTGRTDPNGHNPVTEQTLFIPINGTYFGSSIESDGGHFWFSNYNGPDASGKTPVYRVNTLTGVGHDVPLFHMSDAESVQGIYSPFHTARRLKPLAFGGIHELGMRYDAALDPVPRGHSRRS